MKLILKLILLLSIVPQSGNAQRLSGFMGVFADYPVTATSSALGAQTANPRPEDALLKNPAGLMNANAKIISFSYLKLYSLVPSFACTYTTPIGQKPAGLGVSIYSNGDDLLHETSILVGYARRYQWKKIPINVGAMIALRNASFGGQTETDGAVNGEAYGIGLTLGARIWLKKNIICAIALHDLPNYLSWTTSAAGGYSENLPARLTFGLAARPLNQLSISLDLDKSIYAEKNDRLLAGLEWSPMNMLHVRSGYRWELFEQSIENRLSLGFGIDYSVYNRPFAIDIAYSWEELPSTIWYSLRIEL
jgi:hypothetical protein